MTSRERSFNMGNVLVRPSGVTALRDMSQPEFCQQQPSRLRKVSAACSLSYLPPARGRRLRKEANFMRGATPIGQPVGLRTRFSAPCKLLLCGQLLSNHSPCIYVNLIVVESSQICGSFQ